ncbi:hypothetical protein F4806DRAFT_479529 [Annulohypoxylon nitens]|nr:hypothetical protein F4806DRAFT_479529 [Annulohypoxylon nitens]
MITKITGREVDQLEKTEVFDTLQQEIQKRLQKYPEQISEIFKIDDKHSLQATIAEVETACTKTINGASSKGAKVGKLVQERCSEISQLLEIFSGIADIVNGIDGKGGIVYGALSIFVRIARCKQDHEEITLRHFQYIRKWLPAVSEYIDLYRPERDDELLHSALDVYKLMCYFAIDAWFYCSLSKRRMWLKVIVHPPKYHIQETVNELKGAIEIFKDAINKVHHRHSVENRDEIAAMRKDFKDQETQHWKDGICTISIQIGCPKPTDPRSRARQLRRQIGKLLEDDCSYETMEVGTLRILKKKPVFQQWEESEHSSLLLLRGMNHPDSDGNAPLWLSPAIADFANALMEGQYRIAYHVPKQGESPLHTMAFVICTILRWDGGFFRQNQQFVRDILGARDEQQLEEVIPLLLRYLMTGWGSYTPDQRCYVVVDGIDKWWHGQQIPQSVKTAFKQWLAAMHETRTKVKVCFLMDSYRYSEELKWMLETLQDCATARNQVEILDSGGWRQGNKST